jgi:pimeloyl-ACP methyl ester carboxylesterase
MESTKKTVVSKDGTKIAYEILGDGPVLILVAAALADHTGTTKLARLLADTFTVINYDRRGRGESTDTAPYNPEREIEDIESLINANGGTAYLFGSSSGAVLAIDAASRLGNKVTKLFMYEPPLVVDGTHAPMPIGLVEEASTLVKAGKRNELAKLFFAKGMGMPKIAVAMMRWFMPGWSKMTASAFTVPYDLAIVRDVQTGKPLPASRWASFKVPSQVMVGSRSEVFFHNGAKALAALQSTVEYKSLEGGSHASVLMLPAPLAEAIKRFFGSAD